MEAKAKENVSNKDLKPLRMLAEEKKLKRYVCVSLETRPRTLDAVTILPYQHFPDALWAGEYS